MFRAMGGSFASSSRYRVTVVSFPAEVPSAKAGRKVKDAVETPGVGRDWKVSPDRAEASTTARLRRTVELFRAQYVTLMSSFESTASHVTAELRKVEVNLSQLPRAMDQAGTELNELAALLDRSTKKEEKEPRG
jgi:hypothetical protein